MLFFFPAFFFSYICSFKNSYVFFFILLFVAFPVPTCKNLHSVWGGGLYPRSSHVCTCSLTECQRREACTCGLLSEPGPWDVWCAFGCVMGWCQKRGPKVGDLQRASPVLLRATETALGKGVRTVQCEPNFVSLIEKAQAVFTNALLECKLFIVSIWTVLYINVIILN